MADIVQVKITLDPGTGKVLVESTSKNSLTVVGMLERAKLVILTATIAAEAGQPRGNIVVPHLDTAALAASLRSANNGGK